MPQQPIAWYGLGHVFFLRSDREKILEVLKKHHFQPRVDPVPDSDNCVIMYADTMEQHANHGGETIYTVLEKEGLMEQEQRFSSAG